MRASALEDRRKLSDTDNFSEKEKKIIEKVRSERGVHIAYEARMVKEQTVIKRGK